MKVTVTDTCPAPPEVVWEWIADPHKHVRMLPDEVRNGAVLERTVETDPPWRLVERRVDGNREGMSVFELAREGEHATRVTLTSEVELPRLIATVAAGPVRSALASQLRNLATLVAEH
jgi:carbon monoxide dehydrogenase subunit G